MSAEDQPRALAPSSEVALAVADVDRDRAGIVMGRSRPVLEQNPGQEGREADHPSDGRGCLLLAMERHADRRFA